MQTYTLINEIRQLSLAKQMYIAEMIIKTVRKQGNKSQMELASEQLMNEYETNKELTVFTSIDFDNFYETAK